MFELLVIVVFLNVLATITLWRTVGRRPEKLKKKFLNLFWRSEPITPKHERPPAPEEDDWGGTEQDHLFFRDFEDFANVVNWWLADRDTHTNYPWRLQQLPEFDLVQLGAHDLPTYGRRYAVFHNQVRCGEIEAMPDWEYSTQDPRVTVHIELDWVRLLSFQTIRDFLSCIALHISEYRPGTLEQLQTSQQIDRALMSALWQTQEISKYGMESEPGYGQIEVELTGLASFYLIRRQAFLRHAADVGQQT